jgi:hypothetical protein
MFHLPQMGFKAPLCTDKLVDLVREHRWTGFKFVPIWSSKRGPITRSLRPSHWLTGLETTSVLEALVGQLLPRSWRSRPLLRSDFGG